MALPRGFLYALPIPFAFRLELSPQKSNIFEFDCLPKYRNLLSENQRTRIEEINKELESLEFEKAKKPAAGKSTIELEKRQEELERQKHELVEQIADIWSS